MKTLAIDLETRSSVPLEKAGVYAYAESEDFAVLLFACSVDDGEVQIFDLAHGESLPGEIRRAIEDPAVEKWSYNSAFERVCLSRYLGYPAGTYLPPEGFKCSMTWGAILGLPMGLEEIGAVLHLEKEKLGEGKVLIKRFCNPPFELPDADDPDWLAFRRYCIRDVEAENEIRRKLARDGAPDFIWREFWDSERINDRGVAIDRQLVGNALWYAEEAKKEALARMARLTGLKNPNSVQQLKGWLADKGVTTDKLDKETVQALLDGRGDDPEDVVAEVLRMRQQVSKSSLSKYERMALSVNRDGRVRGMFRFYGAGRTGRFSSRIVQLQNLPKNHMDDLDDARQLLKTGDYAAFRAKYPDVTYTLSQLVRTAFVAGGRFLIADESSIEARVLSYLAGEKWRIKAFADGKDIYCESASKMFGVPVEKNGVNAHLRPKGKVAELALGYGGSDDALIRMGALSSGLTKAELPGIVSAWRAASPRIVEFWYDIGQAAMDAIIYRAPVKCRGLIFSREEGILFITLLSGRRLAYINPRIGASSKFGTACICYDGVSQGHKWATHETYGAKLTENIVQATARDVLCYALSNLRDTPVVMHIHDEIVVEDDGSLTLEELCRIMGQSPPWAEDLLLRADGFASEYYKKD